MRNFIRVFTLLILLALSELGFTLTPPRPGEIEEYKIDGTYNERLDKAKQIGNDKADPQRVIDTQKRLYQLQGLPIPETLSAPPPGWQGGLPTSGNPKVLVILVDFPDYPHSSIQTVSDVQSKMFGTGVSADFPYESLRTYYQRSSYGQLNITGTTLGWYRALHNRSYYQALDYPSGNQALIQEAIGYYNNQGHDFSQYDNDNDGFIDAFFIKWTGPDNGWANFWWAYQGHFNDSTYVVDGKHFGKFVWSWYFNSAWGDLSYKPYVDIHETGHLLGLPDYYDYDNSVGPKGGLGDLDMMDGNWGDHNCFSKFMLGWLNPTVISSGSLLKTFNPSGTFADAVLVMPNANNNTLFSEFFMAQFRKRGVGNDPVNYPTDGLTVWHVDARLDASGYDFLYDNSYTAHKLLRLMEADGLEGIEQGQGVDSGDFYLPPKNFGPTTTPNSNNYLNQYTGAYLDGLSSPASTMTGHVGIAGGAVTYVLTLTKSGTGSGTISGGGSYAAGAIVNLTATPATGSTFAGWSPSPCAASFTMPANNLTCTATFNLISSKPDLIVTSVTSPSSGVIGELIGGFSMTIKNQGTADAGAFLAGIYLSADTTVTTSDIDTGWGCNFSSLAAGASATCGGNVGIPASVAPGKYYLGVYADSKNAISESNESNNGRAASNQITLTRSSAPLPVYRFYNTTAGGHFFTMNEEEKNTVINYYKWFRYEGVGFNAYSFKIVDNILPVYRFYNTTAGGHFFTLNEEEKNTVINHYKWFRYEGVGFYAFPFQAVGTLPVYRFYNMTAGGHFFTMNEAERDTVINHYKWFRYEGVGFYAWPAL